MAKTLVIAGALVLIVVLLIIIALKLPQPIQTTPVPEAKEVVIEQPTPKAKVPERGEPTPREQEVRPPPEGVEISKVYPNEVHFWVNKIRVPETTTYEAGYNFIPLKEDNLKTFAGTFGPYSEDPIPYIRVSLCSEMYKVGGAPTCETVPLTYRDRYVSFAKGYQFDEYIGGVAVKDYIAYYDVYAGETSVAHSNVAVIRTVKD